MVVDDRILPHEIRSLKDFATECTDGNYQLALREVEILRIEKEPFKISEIIVEMAYENNHWSNPRVFTDVEEFGPEPTTPAILEDRAHKITQITKNALFYVDIAIRIVKTIWDFFQ